MSTNMTRYSWMRLQTMTLKVDSILDFTNLPTNSAVDLFQLFNWVSHSIACP